VVTKYQDSVRRALVSNGDAIERLSAALRGIVKVMIERKVRSSFSITRATISSGGSRLTPWREILRF
jgi:hypothetical protein